MPLKDFLWYFTEEDGRSITTQNGIVTSVGPKTPMINSPQGWDDIAIAWERVMKYHGLQRNFALPLKFYRKEAFILRSEFMTKNVERKIFLIIQQLTLEYGPSFYRWLYKYLYKGELDLSTYKSDIDNVVMSIAEGSLMKLFKANENTVYEIPFDEDTKYLFMDGILLDGTFPLLLTHSPIITTGAYVGIVPLASDGQIPGLAIFQNFEVVEAGVPDGENLNYFAEAVQDIAGVTLIGTIKNLNQLGAPGPLSLTFFIWNTVSETLRLTIDLTPDDPYPENYNLEVDLELDLLNGDRLFFKRGSVYDESQLILKGKSKFNGTTIPFYKPFDLYKKLVAKITGSADNAESNLLVANADFGVTCGDAIRGIGAAKSTIKTSLGAFFEDYNVTCFAGLSIDKGKIRMESREIFYDSSDPIDLGEVRKHEVAYAADLSGNAVKVGHVKPDIEDINGRFDPNGSSVFTLPITRVARQIEIVGSYKKGPYEIESKRINLEGKITTDDNIDNDIIVLHVKEVAPQSATVSFIAASSLISVPLSLQVVPGMRIVITGSAAGNDGAYVVEDVANIIVAQLLSVGTVTFTDEANVDVTIELPYILNRDAVVDPAPEVCPTPETIFNVVFTPKNILLKHGRWLRSVCMGFDTEVIKYQSSDKNKEFKAVVNGVTIDEDTDEAISGLGDRLFFPIYHDFETLTPTDIVDLLEANPNRCFKWTDTDTGDEFIGFNIKSGTAVSTRAAQQFKCLSSPLNDVTKMIY